MVDGYSSHGLVEEGDERTPIAPYVRCCLSDCLVHGASYPRSNARRSAIPMGGSGKTVEVDETFIGRIKGVEAKPGWVRHKNTVLTLVERGGSVRSFHIDEATKEHIVPIVNENL